MTGFDSKREMAAGKQEHEALAQPAQEPRQWIWLSDADIRETIDGICQYTGDYEEFLCKKIEQKIRSMNT